MSLRAWLVCALLLLSAAAQAALFTVNSPADVVDAIPGDGICETAVGNGVCTLRAAIQETNALAGAHTINLQPKVTYLLTLAGSLIITDSVAIVGAGPDSTVVDGDGSVFNRETFYVQECLGGGTCDDSHPVNVVSISGITIQNANAVVGAAIDNTRASVTVDNCSFVNNTDLKYAAVYNQGTITINNSTISGNITHPSPGGGGGIYNIGTATIRNSTISGNSAYSGAGIYSPGGTLAIIDSTISGNSSIGSGGGISTGAGTTTSLYNTTVTLNIADSEAAGYGTGGGLANGAGATFNIANSIIAANAIATASFFVSDDCKGTITSQGNNILRNVTAANCTIIGTVTYTDPLLGPLQDNGGPTQTHALLSGSPALQAGNSSGCTDNLGAFITSDQRGFSRPKTCDIGAFEEAIFQHGFEP